LETYVGKWVQFIPPVRRDGNDIWRYQGIGTVRYGSIGIIVMDNFNDCFGVRFFDHCDKDQGWVTIPDRYIKFLSLEELMQYQLES